LRPDNGEKSSRKVALLRGGNFGGRNTVKMARLREMTTKLGAAEGSTYINSGNLTFTDQGQLAAADLEAAMEETFGFSVPILLLSQADIVRVAGAVPETWEHGPEHRCEAFFLFEAVDRPTLLEELTIADGTDEVIYEPGALLWKTARNRAPSSARKKLTTGQLYRQVTARNLNTVRKLANLLQNR